jgi:hypothetical protein
MTFGMASAGAMLEVSMGYVVAIVAQNVLWD